MGVTFGVVAAVLICLVVAGSILGNSLVIGRMIVAAAHRRWFPPFLTVIGRVGPSNKDDSRSSSDQDGGGGGEKTVFDAPVNAILLSAAISALYILFGNFRALLTFNGLGEYSFFFLTVVGAIILRFRQPDLRRPYKPYIIVPVIFAVVSGFVIARGAAFAPVQALILVALWLVGLVYYWTRGHLFHVPME